PFAKAELRKVDRTSRGGRRGRAPQGERTRVERIAPRSLGNSISIGENLRGRKSRKINQKTNIDTKSRKRGTEGMKTGLAVGLGPGRGGRRAKHSRHQGPSRRRRTR